MKGVKATLSGTLFLVVLSQRGRRLQSLISPALTNSHKPGGLKQQSFGDFPGSPWLRQWALNAGGAGLILGWGPRILHAEDTAKIKKKKKRLKKTFFLVLEARGLKSGCWQGSFLLEVPRENPFQAFLLSLVAVSNSWHPWAQSSTDPAPVCLHVAFSPWSVCVLLFCLLQGPVGLQIYVVGLRAQPN